MKGSKTCNVLLNYCGFENNWSRERPTSFFKALRLKTSLVKLNDRVDMKNGMNGHPPSPPQPRRMLPNYYVVGSPSPSSPFLRIVHLCDTHEAENGDLSSAIYEGDVLIHSGNLCDYQFKKHFFKDSEFYNQIKEINEFFGRMPHKYKIFVPGPNEIFFDSETREKIQALLTNCIYLQDSSCTIEGVKFYGTPWSLNKRGNVGKGFCKSLNELRTIWSNIPDDTDVFITHSNPPTPLYEEIVTRIKPKVFMYGNKTEVNGVKYKDNVIFCNGSLQPNTKRDLFDYYIEDGEDRQTILPEVSPEIASEALRSFSYPKDRNSNSKCTVS